MWFYVAPGGARDPRPFFGREGAFLYQALYRKWRPKGFSDVCGQDHIVNVLKREVATGRISHAYLFCGSRGTGKTTCAKILAKAINCERPVDGDPCGECESCRGIDAGSVLDVVEIDAASNNGVDSVREIRSEVVYTPAQVKKRVYIIDEVHMLSQGAWNALLKTLEEPPEHAVFILATTELAKIPATIISRCQHFDFRRISRATAKARILEICAREGITIEEQAAEQIAAAADGSMRDALSILDQCAGEGEVTAARAEELCGLMPAGRMTELASAVADGDWNQAMALFLALYEGGRDVESLAEALLGCFRDVMLVQSGAEGELLSAVGSEAERLHALAGRLPLSRTLLILRELVALIDRLPRTSERRCEFEVGLLRLCRAEEFGSTEALLARVERLEKLLAGGAVPVSAGGQSAVTATGRAPAGNAAVAGETATVSAPSARAGAAVPPTTARNAASVGGAGPAVAWDKVAGGLPWGETDDVPPWEDAPPAERSAEIEATAPVEEPEMVGAPGAAAPSAVEGAALSSAAPARGAEESRPSPGPGQGAAAESGSAAFREQAAKLMPPGIAVFLRKSEVSLSGEIVTVRTPDDIGLVMLEREESVKALAAAFGKVVGRAVTVRVQKAEKKQSAPDPFEALRSELKPGGIVKFTD